jgi:hypothetical protein
MVLVLVLVVVPSGCSISRDQSHQRRRQAHHTLHLNQPIICEPPTCKPCSPPRPSCPPTVAAVRLLPTAACPHHPIAAPRAPHREEEDDDMGWGGACTYMDHGKGRTYESHSE